NFRPITCLPTIHKLLTSVIMTKIGVHVAENNILTVEENGCKKGSWGCKELLLIDSIITNQVSHVMRNISITWVHYNKVFDLVPHSWLIHILRMYKVNEKVIALLSTLMQMWRTRLHEVLVDNGTRPNLSASK
uniref:Reverse transcriptase domain-containing protein n=1 Tax=Latimeria chalumnae TaxID=7897 RepID=H3A5C8_LATCH